MVWYIFVALSAQYTADTFSTIFLYGILLRISTYNTPLFYFLALESEKIKRKSKIFYLKKNCSVLYNISFFFFVCNLCNNQKKERGSNMSVQLKNGDVLQADVNIIVHQVNCMSVMGSGIAKQIRNQYPKVYKEYVEKCNKMKTNRKLMLGDVLYTEIAPNKYIASVFGQYDFGWTGQHTDINALRMGLNNIKYFAKTKGYSIALPYGIGCGRGGADWNEVGKIIEIIFQDMDVEIWKF